MIKSIKWYKEDMAKLNEALNRLNKRKDWSLAEYRAQVELLEKAEGDLIAITILQEQEIEKLKKLIRKGGE